MKIIINSGFERKNAKVLITRNGQEIKTLPNNAYCCNIDADESDTIVVRLKCADGIVLFLASFVFKNGNDVYYVHPSVTYSVWMNVSYKYLPCFCLLVYVLQALMQSEVYQWFCTGMIVFTVLTLLSLQIGQLLPQVQRRLFKLDVI